MSVAILQTAPPKPQASAVPAPNRLLQRKCACGSSKSPLGEMSDEYRSGALQRKFTIGTSNDPLELEADRIADQVLAAPAHAAVSGTTPRIQRFVGQAAGVAGAAPASVAYAIADSGRPLEPALRQDMEQRFGHDFSRVRVHPDAAAGQSAREVNAHAYTVGHDIVFGTGRFAPGTQEGRRLIAHELTHVLQQSGRTAGLLQRSPDEEQDPEEKPTAKFLGCDANQKENIMAAIGPAKKLAAKAVEVFEKNLLLSNESRAMRDHFGSPGSGQKATIIARYKHIHDSLGGKTYTCAKKDKKVKVGKEVVDLCGEAPIPGSEITVFPNFGTGACAAGPTLLHEAAHNAGASNDIDKGRSYPPANAEKNAYSYEYFVGALSAGPKVPELKGHEPKGPE